MSDLENLNSQENLNNIPAGIEFGTTLNTLEREEPELVFSWLDDIEPEFDDTESKLDELWGNPKKQFDKLVKRIGKKGCSYDGRIRSNIDGESKWTNVINKVFVDDSRNYTKITVIYGTNMYYLRYNKKTKNFEKSSSFLSRRKKITDKEARKRIKEIDSMVDRIKTRTRLKEHNPF